jgi:hypothetical protein
MSSMRLIADVHISPLTVAALKVQGYDIVRTTEAKGSITIPLCLYAFMPLCLCAFVFY